VGFSEYISWFQNNSQVSLLKELDSYIRGYVSFQGSAYDQASITVTTPFIIEGITETNEADWGYQYGLTIESPGYINNTKSGLFVFSSPISYITTSSGGYFLNNGIVRIDLENSNPSQTSLLVGLTFENNGLVILEAGIFNS
jgi:hypothetical protein